MKYRNRVTGAILEARCLISGGNWEPVAGEAAGAQTEPETAKQEGAGTAEAAAAEDAAAKPKRSRKKAAKAEE